MNQEQRALVVTTINPVNACLQALGEGAYRLNRPFYVIGDSKTPRGFKLTGATYYDLARQKAEFPAFCEVLPERHYARKNVGYLAAWRAGAVEIQETDDDNLPMESFWEQGPDGSSIARASCDGSWLNVYALFSEDFIWPRGLPLEELHGGSSIEEKPASSQGLIVQGLADDNPDVDAVYRLTRQLPFRFRKRPPVVLGAGTWCPFNSQNTVFRRPVFPLLYLPSYCSFRMTDIWRSFVAQRCLWELDDGVVFHSATVIQNRNDHNLLKDFEDEIPGYLNNERIRCCLEELALEKGNVIRNLMLCYEALVAGGFLPDKELPVVRSWISHCEEK